MGSPVWTAHRFGLGMLALLAVIGAGCRQDSATPEPAPAEVTTSPAPAPAAGRPVVTAGGLTFELVRVQRLDKDLVQVDLVAVNPGKAPVELGSVVSSPAGGLDQSAFTHSSGDVRSFVLHDERGAPQCSSLGPVPPGGRSPLFVRFAALSDGEYQGTIEVPGLPPMAGVAVPAAAGR